MMDVASFISARGQRDEFGLLTAEVAALLCEAAKDSETGLDMSVQRDVWLSALHHQLVDGQLRAICADYLFETAKELWELLDCGHLEPIRARRRVYASAIENDWARLLDGFGGRQVRGWISEGREGAALAVLRAVDDPAAHEFLRSCAPPDAVLVPSGTFKMGGGEKADENPAFVKWLPSYFVGRYPVSVAQFSAHAGSRPVDGGDNFPATHVSWVVAGQVADVMGARLPTEDEWEKAARGPQGFRFPWGDKFVLGRANTMESGIGEFTPVDAFEEGGRSPYGAVDMVGNAWEWTASAYRMYGRTQQLAADRRALDRTQDRVLRGGAFDFDEHGCNCVNRYRSAPERAWDTHGFRIAWGG